jgi:hypothetical protein
MVLLCPNRTIMPNFRDLIYRFRTRKFLQDISQLNECLATKERIFQAPPLTSNLVHAIRLISPHCDFPPQEKYRLLWEADQNGACWGEYEALRPLFKCMPMPRKVLEIGPGMGRSLVFFYKKLGWTTTEFHTFEGEGHCTKYTNQGPRFEDSFCGNFEMLRQILTYNGVNNVTIFDAEEMRLPQLPGPYDYLYSFYSVGFHWSLEYFWDDILKLLHNNSVAAFTLSEEFQPFFRLQSVDHRILELKTAWPKSGHLRLLVLSKSALPI